MSSPVPAEQETNPSRTALKAVLLVLIALAAYIPAFRAGFIWDDNDYVTENSLLSAPDGLQRIWFSGHTQSQYFPLVFTTFRLEHALWGLNPAGYHVVNVLFHAANVLLVWLVLRRLRIPGCWLAAALFAVHPVGVETVAWITELKNTESTLFYLLTVLAWFRFLDKETVHPWRFYVLALVFQALALFAKTTACTVPAALVLMLWLKKEPINWRRLLQILPFMAMGLAMGMLSIWWEGHLGNYHAESGAGFGWHARLLIATRAIWFYAGKVVWPTKLAFSYPKWEINPHEPLQYVWLAGCIAVALILWWRREALGRGVLAGVAFFVAALSPMLGFIWLYTFRYSFVADHYQYLACLGLIAPFAAVTADWTLNWNRSLRWTLSWALLLVLGVLTWRQADIYRTKETLYRGTLANNPESWLAHNNLGEELMQQKLDEAEAHFREAIRLNPRTGEAWNNLGLVYSGRGEMEKAADHYRKALEVNPYQFEALGNLASILAIEKQYGEAAACYEQALHMKPDSVPILASYGTLMLNLGRYDDANARLQEALTYNPNDVKANAGAAKLLAIQGKYPEAIEHYRLILKFEPKDAVVHYNLGLLLATIGKGDEAIAQYNLALQLKPDYADAHNNLGLVLAAGGKFGEALAHLKEALRLNPDNAGAHNNMAYVLDQLGRHDEEIPHLKEALRLNPNNAGAKQRLRELGVPEPE